MLKIKDNVDLKQLEKFGFVYDIDCNKYFKRTRQDEICSVQCDDRIIKFDDCSGFCSIVSLDVLFDLIKADLVEKVEE